ncbi:MAG TPA: GrpB family protein [Ktedonosporobacter sp.]|nr:GrpB family protein [Ktedonosporobacter sp.]
MGEGAAIALCPEDRMQRAACCRPPQDHQWNPDPVWIVPSHESWPQDFQALAQLLRQVLGPVARRIDHIGSTSVPGLAAKPILDIQISVADFEPLDAYRLPLEDLGYIFRADNPNRTQRYFRETPGQPRVHLHVMRAGSFGEQFTLLFREYLRTNPESAEAYGQLKRELAQRYQRADERELYTDAKAPFIWKIIAQAESWAQSVGWFPGPSDA